MSILEEVLLVFSGAPGALGVLAAFSDKVSLGPIPGKIVAQYHFVSEEFRTELFPDIFKFQIPLPHNQISFLIPVEINEIIRERRDGNAQDIPRFWAIYSVVCIFVLAFLFSVQGEVFAGAPSALLFALFIVFDLILFVLLAVGAAAILRVSVGRRSANGTLGGRARKTTFGLGLLISPFIQLALYSAVSDRVPGWLDISVSTEAFILAFATIFCAFIVWTQRLKAPAYVLTCAIGILFLRLDRRRVLPKIDCWLDQPMETDGTEPPVAPDENCT